MAAAAVIASAFLSPSVYCYFPHLEFGVPAVCRRSTSRSYPVCREKRGDAVSTRKRRAALPKQIRVKRTGTSGTKISQVALKNFRCRDSGDFNSSLLEDRSEFSPRVSLDACPALVLNADFQPLSYLPLSLWPWQEVVKAVFCDRVNIVATYDVSVRSPSVIFPLPSVISLKQYQKSNHSVPFSRFNVFLRDEFSCQYCHEQLSTTELTFDHIIPRCMGGKSNWSNVVTACCACNLSKGRMLLKDLPNMTLSKMPQKPSHSELQAKARCFPPKHLHESWRDYVYWNESMECDA